MHTSDRKSVLINKHSTVTTDNLDVILSEAKNLSCSSFSVRRPFADASSDMKGSRVIYRRDEFNVGLSQNKITQAPPQEKVYVGALLAAPNPAQAQAKAIKALFLTLVFCMAFAQDTVLLEDTRFNTPAWELGLSHPMGRRYTKGEFEAAAVPTVITPLGRTQIMSNRPENVSGEGVLYRGTLEGLGSVYFYHVNADLTGRRFAAALRNPGNEPVTVTLTALGTAYRDDRFGYRYAGQEVALEVFSSREPETLTIPAGEWRWLEPELPATTVGYRGGVTLQAELETDAPLEVLIVSLDEETEGIEGLPDIVPDLTGAGRGTFPGADRRLEVALEFTDTNEELGFTVSAGDDWVFGQDEMTGETAQNRGNYGMVYEVHAEVLNDTDADALVRFYAVNIGCIISGAVRLEDGRVFRVPADQLGSLDVNNFGVALGQLPLGAGERGVYCFSFTPPGFSCLPIGVVARLTEVE